MALCSAWSARSFNVVTVSMCGFALTALADAHLGVPVVAFGDGVDFDSIASVIRFD
jgi:hypothetical protein